MIYTGLNRTGEIEQVYAHGGSEVSAVYGSIGEADPIYYKPQTIIGTSPLTFKALGQPLKEYRISGETLQEGTPSPDMPVDVVGCGVRTENLYNRDSAENLIGYINSNGNLIINQQYGNVVQITHKIPVVSGKTYCICNAINSGYGNYACFYDANDSPIMVFHVVSGINYIKTAPQGAAYFRTTNIFRDIENNLMFVESEEFPTSYIPYGYKLPLTVNGTEYPIYLGQLPTTRRIKKLVLTGNETGILVGNSKTFLMPLLPAARRTKFAITVLSNKYNGIPNTWDWAIYGASDNSICFVANSTDPKPTSSYSLAINDSRFGGNVSDFKSYLAAQYAAGTPVTIWYVLYEPETGIVNEPLHKIGDYADTISFAQAGVTIPTVSGANVLDMTSAVKPSEVYIKGKIKPDGYGKLVDKNSTYILDKDGVHLTVHGHTDTPNA